MGSGSFEVEHVVIDAVDEQPVRLDMAVPRTVPRTSQSVITVFRLQRLSCDEAENDVLEFAEILAALFQTFDVPAEMRGLMDRLHWSQLAKRSFALRCVVRPRPLRESASACRVVALGISTGKGNPLRRVIWV